MLRANYSDKSVIKEFEVGPYNIIMLNRISDPWFRRRGSIHAMILARSGSAYEKCVKEIME